MNPEVRVLLFAAESEADEGAVADAYHQISRRLAGTAGLRRNALLRQADAPRRYVVLSEWDSMDAFRRWETGAQHREATAPLRPYQDRGMGAGFGVYTVAAEYVS